MALNWRSLPPPRRQSLPNMGNSQGQLKSSRFEAALHTSIEHSLRSHNVAPQPVFSQLYLEKDIKPHVSGLERRTSVEGSARDNFPSMPSMPHPPPPQPPPPPQVVIAPHTSQAPVASSVIPPSPQSTVRLPPATDHGMEVSIYHQPGSFHSMMRYPPTLPVGGGCQEVGFCQAGGDIRLTELSDKQVDVQEGFVLIGTKSPYLPENILVAAVDTRFLPDPKTNLALQGFSGNCVGCGEKGFRYFTEFSHHINLKLTTQPKKQKHLKYNIITNKQGHLVRGSPIPWKDCRRGSYTGHVVPSIAATNGIHQSPGVKQGPPPLQPKTFTDRSSSEDIDTAQPPKKARRFMYDDGGVPSIRHPQQGHRVPLPPNFVPAPPTATTHDSVFIQPGLTSISHTKPIILPCHGNMPYLHGNVVDVVISPLFLDCFKLPQLPPAVLDNLGLLGAPNLSVETMALITIQYLVQLGTRVPTREELDASFLKARLESCPKDRSVQTQPPQFVTVAPAQLPWLARMVASTSNGRVKVIVPQVSLAEGMNESFRMVCNPHPTVRQPLYFVVIHVSRQRGTEFCVIVAGALQARVLVEARFSIPECFKEISYQIITGKIHLLHTHFKRNCSERNDHDTALDKFSNKLGGKVFLPFDGTYDQTIKEEIVNNIKLLPVTDKTQEAFKLHPVQIAVAMKILSQVCAIADSDQLALDLGRFSKVDLIIITPPSLVVYHQSIDRLAQSGLLIDLGLEEISNPKIAEKYIMRCDKTTDSQTKFETFLHRVKHFPYTLFVVIQDQAHIDINRHSYGAQPLGLADRYVNCPDILESPNVLTLQVTPTPYVLQTKKTRLSPLNEIYMPTTVNQQHQNLHAAKKFSLDNSAEQDFFGPIFRCLVSLQMTNVPPPEKVYFGLHDYIKTTEWTGRLPLLRYDDDFENAANALLASYPRLHSLVIRTYLLVRQYAAALMSLCGIEGVKQDTSTETFNMVEELVKCPMQNKNGKGIMVLIRIPSIQLALLAHERLRSARDKLGLQFRFDVLLSSMTTEFTLDDHFLSRLQAWQGAESNWQPKTYEDLNDLPCIMILSGQHTAGETWPRSLRFYDIRLVNNGALDRTTVEQEIGLVCQYIDVDSVRDAITVCELSEEEDSDTDDTEGEDNEMEPATPTQLPGPPALEPIKTPNMDGETARMDAMSVHSERQLYISVDKNYKFMSDGNSSAKSSSKQTVDMFLQPSSRVSSPAAVNTSRLNIAETLPGSNNVHDDPYNVPSMLKIDMDDDDDTDIESGLHNTSSTLPSLSPPVVVISRMAYAVLKPDLHPSVDRLTFENLPPSRDSTWVSSVRPPLVTTVTNEVKSMFYRQWIDPKNYHYDYERKIESTTQAQHHPRRLLLSGPHQVGKTGAFLHFARVLSRMLIRLQEVEVYDEEEVNVIPALPSIMQPSPSSPMAKWPDFELVSQIAFDSAIHQRKLSHCSPISGSSMEPLNVTGPVERPTTSMMMSQFSAHNAFHHCEQCQHYKDIPIPEAQLARTHRFTFTSTMYGEDLEMQFVIPPQQEKHFVFNHSTGQLESMVLPTVSEKGPNAVKTPIFTPSSGRHEHGLINLFHAMGGAKHLHILVVKQSEMALYKKQWPNHILLILPLVANDCGIGAARFFIKELAYHNLELERNRQQELGIRRQDVWPFILMLDDSCVMWHCHDENKAEDGKDTLVTLKHVLEHIESTPKLSRFAVFGTRQWTSKSTLNVMEQSFSRCHVHTMFFVNVDLTQNVQFDQNRYFCDDVDFNLRINSSGFVICRFNRFSFMKKHINIGGQKDFVIRPKVGTNTDPVSPQHFVCAPDSEDMTPLLCTPQFLLEKYLSCVSAERLFPLAAGQPKHPLLLVDYYLDLGPSITVHCVSSRPHSVNADGGSLTFSGLLLYMVDSFVRADFLKQFKFMTGAKLCLISPDRNSLRRQVVRLDLEDQWRFRLRDEFQTANSNEDKPLFLLTGTHVPV
ncbi:GREB1-like protein [Saccoglossus kowalevskii]